MTAPAATAAGVLVPRRSRLAEALACVTGSSLRTWASRLRREISVREVNKTSVVAHDLSYRPWWSTLTITDPAEAWELLTERLDLAGWHGDVRRAFAAQPERLETVAPDVFGEPWRYRKVAGAYAEERVVSHRAAIDAELRAGPGALRDELAAWGRAPILLPHPATVAHAVALASDPQGIATAEAIAREVVAACEIQRFRNADRVVWRVGLPLHPGFRSGDPRHDGMMREIAALGYALDSITEDAIVLVAPSLGAGGDSVPTGAEERTG